jgi:hypothetical protein
MRSYGRGGRFGAMVLIPLAIGILLRPRSGG